jgi:hypothetical protein
MATNQINSDSHLTLSNLKKNKENYLVFFTSVPKFTKEPTWSTTALNTCGLEKKLLHKFSAQ